MGGKLFTLAFGLNWIRQAPPYDYWGNRDLSGLEQFIADGLFPHASIVHQHFWPSPILYSVARRHGIHLVTTVRDPYDQFVSCTSTSRILRWTQENLVRARGIVLVAVGALILLAFVISRLHGS
jgi:hypothetical protein